MGADPLRPTQARGRKGGGNGDIKLGCGVKPHGSEAEAMTAWAGAGVHLSASPTGGAARGSAPPYSRLLFAP